VSGVTRVGRYSRGARTVVATSSPSSLEQSPQSLPARFERCHGGCRNVPRYTPTRCACTSRWGWSASWLVCSRAAPSDEERSGPSQNAGASDGEVDGRSSSLPTDERVRCERRPAAPDDAHRDCSASRSDYPHEHYTEDDARRCRARRGFAPNYFSGLFKHREGMTFAAYLRSCASSEPSNSWQRPISG
jgi:hypothetical protein